MVTKASLNFTDRTCIVTGAAQGIGAAEAALLAARGASVLCVDRIDPDPTVAAIRASGGLATAWHGDITTPSAAEAIIAAAADLGMPIAVLVNNAGIVRDRMAFNLSDDDWDHRPSSRYRRRACTAAARLVTALPSYPAGDLEHSRRRATPGRTVPERRRPQCARPHSGPLHRATTVGSPAMNADLVTALQEHVRSRLGKHLYPRRILFVDELPRTPSGNVKRAELRQLAESSTTGNNTQ